MFRFFAGACRMMQGSATGEYLPAHTSMIRHDPVVLRHLFAKTPLRSR
ncbi:hypothetical protein ACYCAX_12760 [Pseudomonas sp. MT3]|nr:hypothetical protein [uncultured Pseudomonas sp.]